MAAQPTPRSKKNLVSLRRSSLELSLTFWRPGKKRYRSERKFGFNLRQPVVNYHRLKAVASGYG
jgi:hypothetical protein